MTVSMFYQYLLLHYAAKMYEGTRTARTEVPCYYWACALTLWQRVYFYQPIGGCFWNNPRITTLFQLHNCIEPKDRRNTSSGDFKVDVDARRSPRDSQQRHKKKIKLLQPAEIRPWKSGVRSRQLTQLHNQATSVNKTGYDTHGRVSW